MSTILINAVSAKSGGAATYIENLTQSLSATPSPHRYLIYVPFSRAGVTGARGAVTVVATDIGGRPAWQRFLWDQLVLRRIVRQARVDVLLSSSDFGMLWPPCRQILMLRNPLYFSRPYRTHILPKKRLGFRLEFFLRAWLIAQSVASSDRVMTASQSMLEDVRRWMPLPDRRTCVNPFGVPLERFRGGPKSPGVPGSCRLLYVSEYSDYKNLTTLLRALLLMQQQGRTEITMTTTAHPDQFSQVDIVSRRADRGLIAHPLVASHVTFTGAIPYREIPRLYHEADLFVFPSLAESFGHPLVEAMAAGLPIIASDLPICREICGEAAVYVDPLDPAALADAILVLADDPAHRQRLSAVGQARAASRFNWPDHVRRLIETIDDLAAAARVAPASPQTFSAARERDYYARHWPRAVKPYRHLARYLRGWLDPDRVFRGRCVLDVGAGECTYTRLIAERFSPRVVVACDLFRERMAPAAQAPHPAGLHFTTGNGLQLPFRNGAFDVVFGSFVLHQLPDLRDAVQEIHRVLRPGGCYIGIEPSPYHPLHVARYLFGPHSPNQYLLGPRHLAAFTDAGCSLTIRYFYAKRPWLRGRLFGTCMGITATMKGGAGTQP